MNPKPTTRDEIVATLRAQLPTLLVYHVRSLALFGSFARDEATEESDVDVLVEFTSTPTFTEWLDVRDALVATLGRPVDLVMTTAIKPRMQAMIEREALRVA